MGGLTDDMTRLRDEIDVLHRTRDACISHVKQTVMDLKTQTAALRSDFRRTHTAMAQKAREDRLAIVSGLKSYVAGLATDVNAMRTSFRNAHSEMARTSREKRTAFISNLKQAVSNLRQETQDLRYKFTSDIAGARRAWFGASAAPETPEHKTKSKGHKAKDKESPTDKPNGKHDDKPNGKHKEKAHKQGE